MQPREIWLLMKNSDNALSLRIPQKEIAAHLDLSVRQIQNLNKQGILSKSMTLRECRLAYLDYLQERIERKSAKRETEMKPGTLDFERFRLTKAQADNQERKNEVEAASLAPVQLIEQILTVAASDASGTLDGLTPRIRQKHPELSAEIIESVKEQVAKAQAAINRGIQALPPLIDGLKTQA